LIYNERSLEQLIHAIEQKAIKTPVPMHLKVETGMNRLGIPEEQLDRVIERLDDRRELLELRSVMSHLASSSFSEFDAFTSEQVERFGAICERVRNGIGHSFIRHILNSAGVSRFPEAQYDMVRLGIGLYGVAATEEDRRGLRNIARLRTTISQIKEVARGETVGYDRAFCAERPSRIAIIPIGYADGFSRPLSNGVGIARVNGRIVHVVGKISMDMAFLDVTDVMCQEGDEVVLFDDAYPLTEFARAMNKIPYEAITNISERLPRDLYYPEKEEE
jgi:alanine racemase